MSVNISQQPNPFSQVNEDQIFTFLRLTDPTLRYFKVYFKEGTTNALLTVFKCPTTINSGGLYDFCYVNVKDIVASYIKHQYNNIAGVHPYKNGQLSYYLEVYPVIGDQEVVSEKLTTTNYIVVPGYDLELGELNHKYIVGGDSDAGTRQFLTETNTFYKKVMVGESEPVSFIVNDPTVFQKVRVGFYTTPGPTLGNIEFNRPDGVQPGEYFNQFNFSKQFAEDAGKTWNDAAKYVSVSVLSNTSATISVEKYYQLLTKQELFKEFSCDQQNRVVSLVWRNRLGGYDKYYFVDGKKKSVTDKQNYDGTNLKWDPTAGNQYVTKQTQGNKTLYFPTAINMNYKRTETRSLISPTLDDNEAIWLSSLIESPEVYVEDATSIRPVRVTDSQYQYKRRNIDKIFRLELSIEEISYFTN